jgi:hybrid polyketide synthase/nonribosomal peptide synthetase ACE1
MTVICIPSLDEIEASKISSVSIALMLTNLDNSIFKDITARTMSELKTFFETLGTVLWITKGCHAEEPVMGMTIGFGRSLVLELPDLRLQFLDVDFSENLDPRILVATLLRLHMTGVWEKEGKFDDVLWMNEQELRYQKGKVLTPRLYFNRKMNDRFNAFKIIILENKNVRISVISLRRSASDYSLGEDLSIPSVCEKMKACVPDSIIVEASHALLQPVAVSGSNPIYSVLDTDARTGQTVLCFSSSNESRVAVRPDQSIPITVAKEDESRLLLQLDLELKSDRILSFSNHESLVLVHQPNWELAKRISERACLFHFLPIRVSSRFKDHTTP